MANQYILLLSLILCGSGIVYSIPQPQIQQNYPGQVVFLGDSITHFWNQNGWQQWAEFYNPLGAINTGWPGDWTFDVIRKINNEGIIDNYNVRLAVLLIGTNDLGGDGTEDSVVINIGRIIEQVKAKNPGVKILLLGILPRNGAAVHQKIKNVNARLPIYADNDSVFYLDMENQFSNGLGSLLPGMSDDGVHLTAQGYNTWSQTMNPLFFAIFNGATGTPPTTTTVSPTGTPGRSVIFVGDSITQFWNNDGQATWNQFHAPLGALNVGVSGDRTDQTIHRITVDGIVNNRDADLVVLLIGTNDLSWEVPAQTVADNILIIINLIKEKNPRAKVLLLGVLPRGDSWDGINHGKVRVLNAIIQNFASEDNVWYLNMEDAFSYDLGMVFPELYWQDWLHLSDQGYAHWAETMNPLFFQLLNNQAIKK